MTGGIFLSHGDQAAHRLDEAPYDAEETLQHLLATHPDLLPGDQVDPGSPRRWLLVTREAGVPGEEAGSDRWSLDHLFLDQDGVPTLVEVKRSSDTRGRREVVAQMLDYAANAVVYWRTETVRATFESARSAAGEDPDGALAAFLGEDADPEAFWQDVARNLEAGRVRMVFVADVIPPELRRIVEFLNDQMTPAEVLAVEVRQFVGDGVRALVPRVVGQTVAAQQAKASASGRARTWNEPSYLAALEGERGSGEANVARELLAWAKNNGLRLSWGTGKDVGYVQPKFAGIGRSGYTFGARTNGRIEIPFGYFKESDAAERNPFAELATRQALCDRLNGIPGAAISEGDIDGYPTISLAALVDPTARAAFLSTMDWVLAQFRAADDGVGNIEARGLGT